MYTLRQHYFQIHKVGPPKEGLLQPKPARGLCIGYAYVCTCAHMVCVVCVHICVPVYGLFPVMGQGGG